LITPRVFAAGTEIVAMSIEEACAHMGVSPQVSAAYDILADSGIPPDEAAILAIGAERNEMDPEAFARHFIELRRSAALTGR